MSEMLIQTALKILRTRGEEYLKNENTYDFGFAYTNAANILKEAINGNYEIIRDFAAIDNIEMPN